MRRKHIVIVPHTETGLRPEVGAEITRQGFRPVFCLTRSRDPFAYGSLLRILWRSLTDFIVCEQDVVPPEGGLESLASCKRSWCTCPHWMGDHLGLETTGLVRWSPYLRRHHASVMDDVCAAIDPRYWTRRGWTNVPRDCSPAVLNAAGARACLRSGAPEDLSSPHSHLRATSHDWHGIDSDLAKRLHAAGVSSHQHEGQTIHLHDYGSHPPGRYTHWHQRPYDPAEWPK